jgi:hypothetical protein
MIHLTKMRHLKKITSRGVKKYYALYGNLSSTVMYGTDPQLHLIQVTQMQSSAYLFYVHFNITVSSRP